MFRFILISFALVSLTTGQFQSSAARDADRDARILRSESDDKELQNGKFSYAWDATNGLGAQAEGHIKNPEADPEDQILAVVGSYTYIDANNNQVIVEYTADENGFRPREYFGGKSNIPNTRPQQAQPAPTQAAPAPPPVTVVKAAQPQPAPSRPIIPTTVFVQQAAAPFHPAISPQHFIPQQRPIILPVQQQQTQFAHFPAATARFHNNNNGFLTFGQRIPQQQQQHVLAAATHPNQFGTQFV